MNNEIKEILDDLKNIEDYLSFSEASKLYDYIINSQQKEELLRQEISDVRKAFNSLQQENKKLKEFIFKFFYCSEDEESFTLNDYLELENKVYDLQQEIEKLNDDKRGMLVQLYKANETIDKALDMLIVVYGGNDEYYVKTIEKARNILQKGSENK